jgi:cell division protein ZapA (FtsZ GTPase activity inhibitor)
MRNMKRSRIFWVVFTCLLVFGLSGCSSGAKSTPYATISANLSPNGSESRVTEFQNKGNLNLQGATFLASTGLEVSSTDKNLYTFIATLPTKTTAHITVRLTRNQHYKPTVDELSANRAGQSLGAGLTHNLSGTTYNFNLKYFLPQTAFLPLSSDVAPAKTISLSIFTRDSRNTRIRPVVFSKTNPGLSIPVADGGGEQSGTIVALEVTLNQAGKEFVSAVQEAGTKGAFGVEGNPLGTAQSSALDVVEALNTSADYQDLVTQLDQLQAQAENPINPLTQQAYADDPSVRQNILNEIEAARTELQCDTAAQFFNTEISVGAGLLGLPALSIAIAPIVDWNNRTLRQLMQERVNNIRNMITVGTGSMAPHPVPSSIETTVADWGTDRTTLPPGTWLARWGGSIMEVYTTLGSKMTIIDRGTMTFNVNADSSVTGTATGHFAYHLATPDAVTDGETDYSFPVGGMINNGELYLSMGGMPVPMTFPIVWTPKDGKPETSVYLVGPMIAQGAIKLKSGETLQQNQDNTNEGIRSTQNRTLTIN